MRLLHTRSLSLSHPFVPGQAPDYAILSHRWSDEEVTFSDIEKDPISNTDSAVRCKYGFQKILGACELSLKDGYEWIWIDSCCIDKSSSAELQESINSMWMYYKKSNVCYVYLADVAKGSAFASSEWFTRGWTLQELIAPANVEFYTSHWQPIGTKLERCEELAEITSIDRSILNLVEDVTWFSAAEILSWAAHREVTRDEDIAYSLLGLFDINMPLIYGEGGEKAFIRLQVAIYNSSADHSMFLFQQSPHKEAQALLADSPARFCDKDVCRKCRFPDSSPVMKYRDIGASRRWGFQAHEEIMTTRFTVHHEMSTVFPLLEFEEVSDRLEYLEDVARERITHVAVLNYTKAGFKHGAFCLLLMRPQSEIDSCLRLRILPAFLPDVQEFESKLHKVKLLFCLDLGTDSIDKIVKMNLTFKSDLFKLKSWKLRGFDKLPIEETMYWGEFTVAAQTARRINPKHGAQILCHVISTSGANSLLTFRILEVHDIWSIAEVFEPRSGRSTRKLRRHFTTDKPADRCKFIMPSVSPQQLHVKLRRLPGFARLQMDEVIPTLCYELSVTE